MALLCARWGLRASCLSLWQRALLLHGLESVRSRPSGGRRPQLPPRQQQRLGERLEAGPQVGGCETAWGTAGLIRGVIGRACGVLSHRQYGGTVRHQLGCALQQARWGSAHRDAVRRPAWRKAKGPPSLRAANRCQGLILCAEEARVAPWGSVSDPWARRGRQP